MKAILISIQPPHTDNIFDLVKGIEWRTKPLPTGKHYCYETKNGGGCGKVIGEFTIWSVKGYKNVSHIPVNYIDLGCVPREFLMTYSKGKRIYANFIVNPIRYDKPKLLRWFQKPCICKSEYDGEEYQDCLNCDLAGDSDYGIIACNRPITRPPQSWCYVEELR